MIMNERFTGRRGWIRNTIASGILEEARLAKPRTRTVIPLTFVHFQDIGDNYADGVQRVKHENVKNIACIVVKDVSVKLFFCFNL